MPAETDVLIGVALPVIVALIVMVNLFFQRMGRKEAVKDSEFILADLRLAAENATQPCRLMEIRDDPQAYSVRMQGFAMGPVSYYKLVRFEIFDGNASPAHRPARAVPRGDSVEWSCSPDAVAAGMVHFDRDYEGQLERMFFVMQSGEGAYEAVYCKAGDFMSTGGGILKLSFMGRHLGIVNFGADGTISDAANRRAGIVKWDGASMAATLRGKKYAISRPAHTASAFRILEPGLKIDGLPDDDRMLLLCLSLFSQVYRRARRVARDS
ncbi:hypothetical protein L0Y65_00120 [Candidatus Micrarchaeota archaeon]|nr:hypothetical protein [Candidatus Micrarchaeota archaeon]